jgi:hypothetical protein
MKWVTNTSLHILLLLSLIIILQFYAIQPIQLTKCIKIKKIRTGKVTKPNIYDVCILLEVQEDYPFPNGSRIYPELLICFRI